MENKKFVYNDQSFKRHTYTDGNAVRNPRPDLNPGHDIRQPKKKTSAQVRKNRKNAMRMNMTYCIFLGIAVIIVFALCIGYLQIRSEVAQHSKTIRVLEQQISDKREKNEARYNNAIDSVDMNEVKRKAIDEFGMVHAGEDQIIRYKDPSKDYIKQYENIPKNGALSKSKSSKNK